MADVRRVGSHGRAGRGTAVVTGSVAGALVAYVLDLIGKLEDGIDPLAFPG